MAAVYALKRSAPESEVTPMMRAWDRDDEPPTFVLDGTPSTARESCENRNLFLENRQLESSPRKRIRVCSPLLPPSPPSSVLSSLETNRLAAISGVSEASMRNLSAQRASSLAETIECAARLLGLAEGRPQHVAKLCPTDSPLRKINVLRKISATSSTAPSSGKPQAFWTPELMTAAMDFGMTAPALSRGGWKTNLGTERRLLGSVAPQASVLMTMGL